MEIEELEEEEELLKQLELHARLQIQLDRKFGSLSLGQQLTLILVFLVLVFVLGTLGEIMFLGSPFGTIIASVLAALAVVGMSNGIRSSNIRKFLRQREEAREDDEQTKIADTS
ncbi:MAG TPA: hypothetical protein VNA15_05290 [Candidatus Angelobacter sp.]|nr:hypothetical protein [Candidatus Angelobacter sp.]